MTTPGATETPGNTDESGLGTRFWRLWTAGIVNNLGDGALVVGSGLLATTITRDPRLIAFVSASSMLPWLLLTLPAGVIIDRVDRIRTMRIAQFGQAGVMAALTVLAALHAVDVWILAALAFLISAGNVVFSIAAQSVLPQIVSKPLLVRANSLTYLGQTISFSFVGQSLGGILFSAASAFPFLVETASYLGSAGLLARVGAREAAGGLSQGVATPDVRRGVRSDIAEGLRWLMHHRLLRTLAILLGLNTFANQLASATLVLFATETLGVSHVAYGWMIAASAIGGVVGGIVNTRVVRILGQPTALVLALVVNAVCYAATGLAADGYTVAGLLAMVGFSVSIWNVVSVSMRQALVPAALLGRVNSANRLLGWGLMPLGALIGGLLAHWLGLRAPFLVTGGFRLVVLLAALPVLLPALRRTASRSGRDDA